ncbi:MAG: hypothetical protein FJ125_14960 [Deltaproteobacteria bacterium]|nr:hypothetical protein [Deltaproteobacteria bacterium]
MSEAAARIETQVPHDEQPASARMQAGTRIFVGQLFRQHRQRVSFTDLPAPLAPEPVRRPARVAVMLALAHKLQAAIDEGKAVDRADVARRLGLTRARISQLLDLTLLAPDIQEEVLFLEAVDGVEPVTKRGLRQVVDVMEWGGQRRRWAGITQRVAGWRSKAARSSTERP